MAEYRLANGSVIADEDIDRLCREFEDESLAGRLEHNYVEGRRRGGRAPGHSGGKVPEIDGRSNRLKGEEPFRLHTQGGGAVGKRVGNPH